MVYIFTISNKNYGIGHLSRMLNFIILGEFLHLLVIYSDENYKQNIIDYINKKEIKYNIFINYKIITTHILTYFNEFNFEANDTVIFDGREFFSDLLPLFLKFNVKIISWDDYSKNSKNFSHIKINSLPDYRKEISNFSGIIYNPFMPELYELLNNKENNEKNSILISFGGSDPANIAEKVVSSIINLNNYKIRVVKGPLCNYSWLKNYGNIEIIDKPENLIEFINKSEIIFTTIGITMLESLLLKKRVVLINPTKYHNKIAKTVNNVNNLGYYRNVKKNDIINALKILNNKDVEYAYIDKNNYKLWIKKILNINIDNLYNCPVCYSPKKIVIERNNYKTLYKCKNCFSNYQYIIQNQEKNYDINYFIENHKKTYGVSYIEDENNIRNISVRRIKIIKDIMKDIINKKLLDIGSALGIFLDEARKQGFQVIGCEISEYARNYCKERFFIDCYDEFFKIKEKFDVITIWFVLEHLYNPEDWIKKIYNLLNDNGILGLACPNGNGAFAKFNKKLYIEKRPIEHYFEPSIKGMINLLERNKFKIEKIEIFGLHPERYYFPNFNLVKQIQKYLKIGDTFEIYAKKI